MLHICRSNAVESLLASLARRLEDAPLSSPFARELVVTPSPAMARWVNLQLARAHGVAANYGYPLPASFVWELARELLGNLPEADPLEREVMAWKLYARLPGMLAEPAFEPLRHYLREDVNGLKRWQLANRIADVFDRYQLYRPALIREWDAGKGEDWQAALWRRLTEGLDQHRVAVIERLLERLSQANEPTGLAERISLFAVSSLPPLFVEVVHALAIHTCVDLYLHSPTQEFWADLISQKDLARKRLEHPDEADLWEVGNSLLASWGRQGQALQDLLLARERPLVEIDAFIEPKGETLLERLHQDIYMLRPVPGDEERLAHEADGSVQVHICHSGLRECQVLHDQLLSMLERNPALRPEDILVMVPEISRYAPYVEAVFGRDSAGSRPFMPWNLSDISLRDEHPLVLVFLQLLDLPNSRFSHSEVLSYLDVPELAEHFGLDSEALAQIRDWLAQANLRWGLDGRHKQRLGLPAVEQNTWAQAEQRLFGGYALGEGARFGDIAPITRVEGTKGEVLGRFWRLFSQLVEYAQRLSSPRAVTDWQATVGQLLGDFFGETEDQEGRLQKIRDALAELAGQTAELQEAVPLPLLRQWLEQRLGTEGRRGRYFSGGVTFCGMRPMRSLPFAVICLLGMQDQVFPRRDQLAEFDAMRAHWRPGDPRKGDEDRYLLLETLLCARECLYISYVGRDIRKNTERQPSVLVRELLDYIDQHYRVPGADDKARLSERLTRVHPMQPFSPDNYTDARVSFDDTWCEVAQAMVQATTGGGEEGSLYWTDASLPPAPETMREVPLAQLDRFVRHPVRYFVNARLKVYLREEPVQEDDEVFTLDGLQRFNLKQRLVDEQLQGRVPSLDDLVAEGILPHGAFAALSLEAQADQVGPLIDQLEDFREQRPEQIPVDLAFDADAPGPHRLVGQIKGIYPGLGLLRYRPSALKGADILSLWLAHLAWCASAAAGEKCSSLYTAEESFTIEKTLEPVAARAALARYLHWYWQGVHRPLLVLPKASYAYAEKVNQGGRGDPGKAAWSQWDGNAYRDIPGDKDDAYIELVMRGVTGEPLEHPDFPRLAGEFYDQALDVGYRR